MKDKNALFDLPKDVEDQLVGGCACVPAVALALIILLFTGLISNPF